MLQAFIFVSERTLVLFLPLFNLFFHFFFLSLIYFPLLAPLFVIHIDICPSRTLQRSFGLDAVNFCCCCTKLCSSFAWIKVIVHLFFCYIFNVTVHILYSINASWLAVLALILIHIYIFLCLKFCINITGKFPLCENVVCCTPDSDSQTHYAEGDYIIRQGATGDTFFIISKGQVKFSALCLLRR